MTVHRGNSRLLKMRLWESLHGTASKAPCHWCKRPLWFREATVDHEPPLCKGGSWEVAVLSCDACNQQRNLAMSEEAVSAAKRRREDRALEDWKMRREGQVLEEWKRWAEGPG